MKMMDSDYCYPYYICRQSRHSQTIALSRLDTNGIWQSLGGAVPVQMDEEKRLLSFYDSPGYLLCDKLQQIIGRFCENMEKKPIAIVDVSQEFSALYWLCRFRQFECKNIMASLAVPRDAIEDAKIFQLKKGLKIYLVLETSLAEEILKAGFADIEFEGVCMDE